MGDPRHACRLGTLAGALACHAAQNVEIVKFTVIRACVSTGWPFWR